MKNAIKTEGEHLHEPIDLIYEPLNDEISIECFLTDNRQLTYRSYCSKKVKDDYKTQRPASRQCYYCNHYFDCSSNKFFEHVKSCSDIAGIVNKFENHKIISF